MQDPGQTEARVAVDREALERAVLVKREIDRREDELYPGLMYARRYHLNTRAQPMDFRGREYLLSMYKALPRPDRVPKDGIRICVQKCVQMGASEWAICLMLAYAGEHARAIMYVLPKYDLKYTFTSNRVDKPINRVPYYAAKLKETVRGSKTKALKDFGKGVIKVVGSNVETEFVEFPADVVIVDEADQCDQSLIPIAEDRLKGPGSTNIHIKLGNPTIETGGLHADFQRSTRMEWYVACRGCGKHQEVRFFGNVLAPPEHASDKDAETAAQKSEDWGLWQLIDPDWTEGCGRDINAYCRFCSHVMDRTQGGAWWEENPGASVIGFHMSKTMDPTYPLYKLYERFDRARYDKTEMQLFFNYDLGIPYTAYDAQLSPKMLRACLGSHRSLDSAPLDVRCVMGIDVGTVLHYWIETLVGPKPKPGVKPRVLKVGYCKDFDELHRLVQYFNVACSVIDARPEGRLSMQFCQQYRRGRAWRCDYEYHGLREPQRDWHERLMKADRTISMDISHGEFAGRLIELPHDFMTLQNGQVVEQMCSSVRVKEVKPNGQEMYVWDPKEQPDHWRHAKNYASLAQRMYNPPTSGAKV